MFSSFRHTCHGNRLWLSSISHNCAYLSLVISQQNIKYWRNSVSQASSVKEWTDNVPGQDPSSLTQTLHYHHVIPTIQFCIQLVSSTWILCTNLLDQPTMLEHFKGLAEAHVDNIPWPSSSSFLGLSSKINIHAAWFHTHKALIMSWLCKSK